MGKSELMKIQNGAPVMLQGVARKNGVLWLLAVTSVFTFAFLHQMQHNWKPVFLQKHEFLTYNLEKEEPTDPQQKCQLPKIHPFDPSILNFLSPPKDIRCKERQASLTFIDENGFLKLNQTTLKLKGYVASDLLCHYQEIIRKNDFEVEYGEKQRLDINGSLIQVDFVYVSCSNFIGIDFYSNVHCHVVPKLKSFTIPPNLTRGIVYNVLIIGIDSLSRLSFIRGMTKVGDNTFPNLVAMLTGKSAFSDELPKVDDPHGTYDEWPCVWKNFSKAGYSTLFAEDRPDIGLFNYLRGGLKNPPTDHYLRPYWLVVETSKLHRLSSNMCFGTTPKHLLQLRYTKDFVTKYDSANRPFFAFSFLVELSHDYVSQVSSADDDLEAWLRGLFEGGHLNRTFLFFMSDHGHRFDPMRATLVGRIEERMPFLALVVPPSLHETHPEVIKTLKINEKRLTTPYDIYFTTLDLLNHGVNATPLGSTTSPRGTTLFGSVSPNRTCLTAGIPAHYCTCETEEKLDSSDPRSQKAAITLVDTINNLLAAINDSRGQVCSELSLTEIRRADLIVPRREVIVNSRVYFGNVVKDRTAQGMISKIRIIIRTVPGNALFEATLLFREDTDSISVLGDISRINRYGNQSACISDATLRKYCYCANTVS